MSLIINKEVKRDNIMFVLATLCLAVVILMSFSVVFAEEKQENSLSNSQSSKKECIEDFNIDTINFEDPKVLNNLVLLKEYFICKAVVNEDISYCDKLRVFKDECKGYCTEYSKMSDFANLTASKCDQYKNKDIKIYKECMASISGDLSLFKDAASRNKAIVLQAIKTKNNKKCYQTTNNLMRSICQGYVDSNDDACEENVSFKEFRRRYCSN